MYKYITQEEELLEVVEKELKPYLLTEKPIIALDLETYIPDNIDDIPRPILKADGTYTGQIRTLQLGLDPNKAISLHGKQFIIDVKALGYELVSTYLKPILESSYILGHNLKYDYQFLYALLNIKLKKMIDTMLIGQVLYAGDIRNHGLVDVYQYLFNSKERYAWFKLSTKSEDYPEGMSFLQYKEFKSSQQAAWWGDTLKEKQLRYAADDVFYIFYCLEIFKDRLDKWEKTYEAKFEKGTGIRSVINLECSLISVYALMELRGVHVDLDYHKNHVIRILEEEKLKAQESCKNITRTYKVLKHLGRRPNRLEWEEEITEPINLNSPAQLKPKLEELINNDLPAGRKIQLDGTGEDIVKRFLNDQEYANQLSDKTKSTLRTVLNYKKASSLLSKFGQKLIDEASDRSYIHPNWFQLGSVEGSISTGRSSCKGPNYQQIPSRGFLFNSEHEVGNFFRTAYRADKGYKMVCADYSQIEARLAALICKNYDLVKRFNDGSLDIYGAIAKAMMDLDYEPKKDSDDEQEKFLRNYIGKTAGLSLLYGTHWRSLGKWMFDKTDGKVNWDSVEAETAYNKFFKNFPEFRIAIDEYRKRVAELPELAGKTLYPFTKRNREGELVPYFVAFSAVGLKRPRRFVLKPDYLNKTEDGLSFRGPKPVNEDGVVIGANPYNASLGAAAREGFNHQIQSTAANILKYAAYLIHNEFIRHGFEWQEGIVALVHDEVLCHVKEEHVGLAKAIVEACMQRAGEKLAVGLAFKIKAGIGDTWSAAK